MKTSIVRNAKAPARWWRRLRSGARHRANRREAGLTRPLGWEDSYSLALDALEVALQAEAADAEQALARLFLPLSASEMTTTAVALAVLARPSLMDSVTQADIEQMRFQLAWHWESEVDR